jgi:hypothetical protein
MHKQEYEVERVVLNALATGMRLRRPIVCAFGDLAPIVFGEADPPGNDAANIVVALGLHQNRVVGFPRPTRKKPRGLQP